MKSYPLDWPTDRPRARRREAARTTVTLASARSHCLKQLELCSATHVVMSSNAKLRMDGLPYSKQPAVADPGVAVYFRLRYSSMTYCLSCDLNDTISGNIRAIGLSIAEFRGIGGRLGISLAILLDRFAVKEEPEPEVTLNSEPGSWREVLQVAKVATWAHNYKRLAKLYHPDKPTGSTAKFQELQAAFAVAKLKFGYK